MKTLKDLSFAHYKIVEKELNKFEVSCHHAKSAWLMDAKNLDDVLVYFKNAKKELDSLIGFIDTAKYYE